MAKETDPEKMSRRQQFVETFRMTRRGDPAITWWLLGAFLVVGGLGFAVFYFLLPGSGVIHWVISVIGAFLFGSLAAMIIFGRRAQRAAYNQMEGQPGAAAAALRMLKRGWKTDPVIAFNKQQDIVHRVVGPPGIVLIGEGNPNRVKQLMTSERRKHERVAAEVPIHEIVCGNAEGQVPLPKLVRHVQKLGRSVKPAEMTDVLNRLKALDAHRPNIPLPKGPVPTSMKGMRQNMRGR
jgi:TM2 domain-containing membrane protein YozV